MNPNQMKPKTERTGESRSLPRARKEKIGKTTLKTMGAKQGGKTKLGGTTTVQDEILGYNVPSIVLDESYFDDVYDAKTIQADKAWVAGKERDFQSRQEQNQRDDGAGERGQQVPLSKIMEDLIVKGVQQGYWLGNIRGGAERGPGRINFETDSFYAAKTDDYSRRLDAFTTMKLNKPVLTELGDEITQIPLGFDVTVNGDRKDILDKLTRSYNDGAQLPFGFSHLKYYTDGTTQKGELPMIPRYVIGLDISRESANVINKQLRAPDANNFSGVMLEQRFKVLSEIRAQNQLFSAMLPDGAYDSEDPQMQSAVAYLDTTDKILKAALVDCAGDIVNNLGKAGFYFADDSDENGQTTADKIREAKATLGDAASGKYPELIRKYYLHREHQTYLENQRDRAKAEGRIYDELTDQNDSTFVTIIRVCETLSEKALDYAPELESRRGFVAQNKALELE